MPLHLMKHPASHDEETSTYMAYVLLRKEPSSRSEPPVLQIRIVQFGQVINLFHRGSLSSVFISDSVLCQERPAVKSEVLAT